MNNNNFVQVSRELTKNFSSNKENRAINRSHVSKIKSQMKDCLGIMPPITVNLVTNHVIDGQHRLEAFQSLIDNNEISNESKLWVMYVDIPIEKEREAIINANTNSRNWSIDDYIKSYAKVNDEYKKLDDWCASHELCHEGTKNKYRYAAAMLKGEASSKSLKDGSFTISDIDYERGDAIHTELYEIVLLLNKPLYGPFYEYMAVSWDKVRKLHLFKEWLSEMKKKKKQLISKPFNTKNEWDNIFSIVHMAIDKKLR